ncbi:MAG: hypothetical protein NXI32_26240, partial [bacterium]|nr:hypothetical protein [bacterium]
LRRNRSRLPGADMLRRLRGENLQTCPRAQRRSLQGDTFISAANLGLNSVYGLRCAALLHWIYKHEALASVYLMATGTHSLVRVVLVFSGEPLDTKRGTALLYGHSIRVANLGLKGQEHTSPGQSVAVKPQSAALGL